MKITIRPALAPEAGMLTDIAFASKRHWQYPEGWIELWAEELTITTAYIRSHEVFCSCVSDEVAEWYALCGSEAEWALDYF